MCYEFSLWSRKLRARDEASKEVRKPEQATKQPVPAPQPTPVAAEAKDRKRETIPA